MRTLLIALLALAALPSLAEARNAKGITTIRVVNNGPSFLLVIADGTVPQGTITPQQFAAFVRSGGLLVGPGGEVRLVVRSNAQTQTHDVSAAYVLSFGSQFTVGASDTIPVTVTKGGTVTVTANKNPDGSATLSGPTP